MTLLLSTLVSACATDRTQLRKEARERETLNELVEGYWHALRWGYDDMAADYLEHEADRGALREYLLSRKDRVDIGEVTIYRLELDDDLKHATVSIQYEILRKNEAVLHKVTARQRWYLSSDGHWYLEFDADEMTRLD